MEQKIFTVCFSSVERECGVELAFPAYPYELMDALDRARAPEKARITLAVTQQRHDFDFLTHALNVQDADRHTLHLLNALAGKLSALDVGQKRSFEETFRAETGGGNGRITPERLYELADSAGAGKEEFHNPAATPDYAVLLEVTVRDASAQLRLPATERILAQTLKKLGIDDWQRSAFRCVDCRIPALAECISKAENVDAINHAARKLKALPAKKLPVCKAILELHGFENLSDALNVLEQTERYTLEPDKTCPGDVAREELEVIISEPDIGRLIPYVDMDGYGRRLMAEDHLFLSSYGIISEKVE